MKIVFFDGVCGLCNSFVQFLLGVDKRVVFKFATLQGETSKTMLDVKDWQQMNSIVYYEDGRTYRESEAIVRISSYLSYPWRILSFTVFFPRIVRNTAYKIIAKNRYKFFGENDSCRIPTPDEKVRFLN